jgi:hypothetical protein
MHHSNTTPRFHVLVIAIAALLARSAAAAPGAPQAPPEGKAKYTAFDLARNEIQVDGFVAGEVPGPPELLSGASALSCAGERSVIAGHVRITVTPDKAKTCPLFAAREPDTFVVRVPTTRSGAPSTPHTATVEFDKGAAFAGALRFDGSWLRIGALPIGDAARMCFAYYSPVESHWVAKAGKDIALASATELAVALPLFEPSGVVYAMYASAVG